MQSHLLKGKCEKYLFLLFIHEVNMSKRRNPKKEKAQRNKAYARKFRKRQTMGRFSKNQRWKTGKSNDNEMESEEDRFDKDEQRQG